MFPSYNIILTLRLLWSLGLREGAQRGISTDNLVGVMNTGMLYAIDKSYRSDRNMEELKTFEELVENDKTYLSNLLFGNGFSINFGSKFMYSNLFEEAKELFIDEDINLFGELNTTNFEYALRVLDTSINTNKIFNIDFVGVAESYERIKSALIETVRKVHPEPQELTMDQDNDLKTTFRLFQEKVFTTN